MGNDAIFYRNENSITAFFAGAINVLTDNLALKVNSMIQYEDVAADIFYIGDKAQTKTHPTAEFQFIKEDINQKNEISISEIIKKRLMDNWIDFFQQNDNKEELIDKINIELEERSQPMQQAIYNIYSNRKKEEKEKLIPIIEEYCREVQYYLGSPKRVYQIIKKENDSTFNINGAISKCYMYIIFDIIFIEFNSYILMIIRGTNE